MLTAYLYEKHVVAEQHLADKKVDKKPSSAGQEGSPASVHGGDSGQAVNELNKWMRENTDARILRKGRKMQKGKSTFSSRWGRSVADVVVL
jgi:hypothetical protein